MSNQTPGSSPPGHRVRVCGGGALDKRGTQLDKNVRPPHEFRTLKQQLFETARSNSWTKSFAQKISATFFNKAFNMFRINLNQN
jgi:hypothetical protein